MAGNGGLWEDDEDSVYSGKYSKEPEETDDDDNDDENDDLMGGRMDDDERQQQQEDYHHHHHDENATIAIDTPNLFQQYLSGYTVCRRSRYSPTTIPLFMSRVLTLAVRMAKRVNSKSLYMLLYPDGDLKDQSADPCAKRRAILPTLLDSGKLNGCALQGDIHRKEFWVVATKNLEKGTPIAVDCGVVWSGKDYDKRMQGVATTESIDTFQHHRIPVSAFRHFFSETKWTEKLGKWATENSFVIESSKSGNEIKFMDDTSWTHCSAEEMEKIKPNVDSQLVLNLAEETEGDSPLTVCYYVNQDVKQGQELVMNWGAWDRISNALPRQAFLSYIAVQLVTKTKLVLEQRGIAWPDQTEIKTRGGKEEDELFCELQRLRLSQERALKYSQQDTSDHGAVSLLYHVIFMGGAGLWRPPKNQQDVKYKVVSDFEAIGIDPTLVSTRRPLSLKILSEKTRKLLDSYSFKNNEKVQQMLNSNVLDYVEVGEIVDMRNPAKLFGALPGEKAHGVFAMRDFDVGDPIMCYAGYLTDHNKDAESLVENAYVFQVKTETFLDKKQFTDELFPDLVIDGKKSIAGLINDPVSLGLELGREANLKTVDGFNDINKNPMILLEATKKIYKGDELLYSYKQNFWKETSQSLMERHQHYTIQAELYNDQLQDLLDYDC